MNYENMLTLQSRLGNYDAATLLDVGVGRGDFLKFVINSFHSWKSAAGIDNDPEALQLAKKEFEDSQVILVLGSALAMPFMDNYFDTVTMSNALHHIENLTTLFSETARICKPKGMVIINEMINESYSDVHENYMLYHRFISDIDNQQGKYHRETYALKEMLSLIKTPRFQLIDYFIHAEAAGDIMDKKEIEKISDRMRRKVALLRGSDYYYFYENKANEIINRFMKTGILRPRHATFILQVLD
jgi:ubiquinone/menaquinone biosynthesis C-methylase UbiE